MQIWSGSVVEDGLVITRGNLLGQWTEAEWSRFRKKYNNMALKRAAKFILLGYKAWDSRLKDISTNLIKRFVCTNLGY